MKDSDAMSEADIQKMLDRNPWGKKSVLATYEQDGKSAAKIIHAAAVKHGINPLVLLTRLQMEQGLINKTTASAATIEIAFGCGCPHSPVCSDRYMGFENQTECAAGTLSRSMVAATTSTGTVSGWARNRTKQTQDGVSITPKNAATAALYTYTPWVGEAGGGRAGVGGASLHHAVWNNLATAANYGAWANGDTAPAPSTPTNGTNEETENTAQQPQPDAAATPEPPEGEEEPTPTPTPTPDAGSSADSGPAPSPDGGAQLGQSASPPSDGSEDEGLLTEGSAPPSSNTPPAKPAGRRSPEELPEASEEELAAKPKKASEGGCSMTSTGAATGDGLLFGLGLVAALVRSRKRSKAYVSE
jgi:MYXO-CTERM domain-containing protein